MHGVVHHASIHDKYGNNRGTNDGQACIIISVSLTVVVIVFAVLVIVAAIAVLVPSCTQPSQ